MKEEWKVDYLEQRLKHLLQSNFIKSFDEKNSITGEYKRDIKEADELTKPKIEMNIFDQREVHHNCTVEILKNSITGEISVGWYRGEEE